MFSFFKKENKNNYFFIFFKIVLVSFKWIYFLKERKDVIIFYIYFINLFYRLF